MTRQDASHRSVAEYLNIPIRAPSLQECINDGHRIERGRITFSDGALWYSYGDMRFIYDDLGSPNSLNVNGLKCLDPEYMTHAWLADIYPQMLEAQGSVDPCHIAKQLQWPDQRILLLRGHDLVRVVCRAEMHWAEETLTVHGRLDRVDSTGDVSFSLRVDDVRLS